MYPKRWHCSVPFGAYVASTDTRKAAEIGDCRTLDTSRPCATDTMMWGREGLAGVLVAKIRTQLRDASENNNEDDFNECDDDFLGFYDE